MNRFNMKKEVILITGILVILFGINLILAEISENKIEPEVYRGLNNNENISVIVVLKDDSNIKDKKK